MHGVALTPLGDVVRGCIEIPELQIRDFELQQTFRGVYDGPVTADPAEVSDIRIVTMNELVAQIAATPDDFTPWLRSRLRAFGWAYHAHLGRRRRVSERHQGKFWCAPPNEHISR